MSEQHQAEMNAPHTENQEEPQRPSRRLAWLREVFRMSGEKSQPRVGLVILGFSALFIAITGRGVMLAAMATSSTVDLA